MSNMKKKPNWLKKIEKRKAFVKKEVVNPRISDAIKATKKIVEEQISGLNRQFTLSKNTKEILGEIAQDLSEKKEILKASSAWKGTMKALNATKKSSFIPLTDILQYNGISTTLLGLLLGPE